MPKKNKVIGGKYKIGSHPIKSSVNQWLASLAKQVVTSTDPWALLLESEATLTIQALTKSTLLTTTPIIVANEDQKSLFRDDDDDDGLSTFKEENIVIPQPDEEQLTKIKYSCPKVQIFPINSHQLLSDLQTRDDTDTISTSFQNTARSSGPPEDRCSNNYEKLQGSCRSSLLSRGWPGWFDFVWLDYCGKVSSGSASRLRKFDLELLFKSGMIANQENSFLDNKRQHSRQKKLCLSVLAITMSKRATPLR